jgi:hypothetical protein
VPVRLPSYDLSAFDLEDGVAVANQKRIVALAYAKLEDAAKLGDPRFDQLQDRYLKAADALRRLQKDDREDREKRGDLLSRVEVENDLAQMAEYLRQTRTSMARRVLELCPSLSAELRLEVEAAVERARESEDQILARLDVLTPEDLLKEMAA